MWKVTHGKRGSYLIMMEQQGNSHVIWVKLIYLKSWFFNYKRKDNDRHVKELF